jgi:hypothetical protein
VASGGKVKFPDIILASVNGSVLIHIYMILLQIELPMLKFNLLECKVPILIKITDEDGSKVVVGLALRAADRQSSIEQIKKLYELFCKCDCTLLEI